MREVMREMAGRNMKREEVRSPGRVRKGEVSARLTRKPCIFKYALPEAKVGVEICFQDSAVEKAEVVKVLRLLLAKLEEE